MIWTDEPSIVRVSSASALTAELWNSETGVVVLSRCHSNGAAEVAVS